MFISLFIVKHCGSRPTGESLFCNSSKE